MVKELTTTDAINQGLTARHIAANLANYEAARTGFFVLLIDDPSNFLKPNYNGGINDPTASKNLMDASKVQEAIRLNCVGSPVPTYSVKTMQYTRGNDVVNFAGTPEWKTGSIKVDDIVGLDTKSMLQAWLRLAYDPHTFKGGLMKDYKKKVTLLEYTQNYQLIRTWTIYGCFITDLQENDFDKENDGKRQITASFVYDYAIPNIPEEVNE